MIWADLQDELSSHFSSTHSFYSQQLKESLKFSLQIYPKGQTEDNTDEVGIFLFNENSEKVGVSASIHLANQIRKKEFSKAIEADSGWGFPGFITCKELAENKLTYLPQGHLDIHCQFTFYIYAENKPTRLEAAKSCEPLKDSMRRLLVDATLSDTIIVCGQERFHCHRGILANRFIVTFCLFEELALFWSVLNYGVKFLYFNLRDLQTQ